MNTFYAVKKNQTHVYDTTGKRRLVTKFVCNPATVTQVKTIDKDGYDSLQVGFGAKKRINKPLSGHLKTAGVTPKFLKEIRLETEETKAIGDTIAVSEVFKIGDIVKLRSKSIGKGFAGVIKRHGFAGGPRTHGQSDRGRAPGSIGQGTSPGRIWKGKKMAGHMGTETVSIRGGQVVFIDNKTNELWITGVAAGSRGSLVEITKIGEKEFKGLEGIMMPQETEPETEQTQPAETDTQNTPEPSEPAADTAETTAKKEE